MATPKLVYWRGKRFTPGMRDQLVEAQRLAGRVRLTPTQGSFSNGVAASAGTHAREAIDLSVRGMSTVDENTAIRSLRTVGIWASVRPAIPGLWPRHIHGMPVGGDLSPAAQDQVDEARRGGDGLKGNAPDPHAWMQLPVITWQQYLERKWPLPKGHAFGDRSSIPRWNVLARRRIHDGTENANHARWVRKIKRSFSIQGGGDRYGPVTAKSVRIWQKAEGITPNGLIGPHSARERGLLH